jgi:hypothetical protein
VSSTVSSADPSLIEYPYAGWIPTVTGRLSFRHIGESRLPSLAVYANFAASSHRAILAYQKRDLSDAKFKPIVHLVFNLSGTFWFVLEASSREPPGEEEQLFGKIHIYKSKHDWRSLGEDTVRDAIYTMRDAALSSYGASTKWGLDAFNAASVALTDTADISTDFVLNRNGDVFFADPIVKDFSLKHASIDYAKQWGHDFLDWAVNQSYFFLRDVAHRHQHHEYSDDTVIILQKRDSDDVLWRRRVIYSLFYHIIGTKRSDGPRAQIRGLGILAYCESFQANCKRRFKDTPSAQFPEFNSAALRASVEARIQEDNFLEATRQYQQARRSLISSNIRNYTIAVLAMVIAVMALLVQPHISGDERERFSTLYNLSIFVTVNFFRIGLLLLAIFIVVWATTTHLVLSLAVGRDVLEVSLLRRRSGAIFFMGLGLVLLSGVIWFEWSQIAELFQIRH